MMNINIFEDIGGQAAVDAAVDIFYRIVLSDESIASFFDDTVDIDHDAQFVHQKSHLTKEFDGHHHYMTK
ncbi:MAG: hemoglobin [Paraglaciecola sp.]|jgi:hemoglobin